MQAHVERSKDRDRTREAHTPAEVVPDLADQFATGSTFDRVHRLSQPEQVTICDGRTQLLKRRATLEELPNCRARSLATHSIEAPRPGRARPAAYHGVCELTPDAQERDADALPQTDRMELVQLLHVEGTGELVCNQACEGAQPIAGRAAERIHEPNKGCWH
jgi:hypothetical protein